MTERHPAQDLLDSWKAGQRPEEAPDPERTYEGTVGGIAIYSNPHLQPGTIIFRNRDGEVIGVIHNVKQIDTVGRL